MSLDNFKFDDSLKKEYIELQSPDNDIRAVMISRIRKISEYEEQIDKDMLSWSEKDFDSFFRFLNYKKPSVSKALSCPDTRKVFFAQWRAKNG